MKKAALLIAVFVLMSSATAEAQVFVRRPMGRPVAYTARQPVAMASPAACCQPVRTYYTGNPCGNCCGPAPCCGGSVTYQPVNRGGACCGGGPGYQVRRGLLGQPTVFVPGQPVRNLLRFLTP